MDVQENGVLQLMQTDLIKVYFTGSPLLEPLKILERNIRSKKNSYNDKIDCILSVLQGVIIDQFPRLSEDKALILFQYIYKNILSIVLHADWLENKVNNFHMRTMLVRLQSVVRNPYISNHIKYLIHLMYDPWGFTIRNILSGQNCLKEEILNLVLEEMNIVMNLRLEALVFANCNTQALLLLRNCLHCINDPEYANLFINYSFEINTMKDIYLILLIKLGETDTLTDEVTKMSLTEVYMLILRTYQDGYLARLQACLTKVSKFVVTTFLTNAVTNSSIDEKHIRYLIGHMCDLYEEETQLLDVITAMSSLFLTSYHIYILVEELINRFGLRNKIFCTKLLVRAITLNLNEMEKYKLNKEQKNDFRQSEVQLSNAFLFLANYMRDDMLINKECVLTSYSLNPTASCYNLIKKIALFSEKTESINYHKDIPKENINLCLPQICDETQSHTTEQKISIHRRKWTSSKFEQKALNVKYQVEHNISNGECWEQRLSEAEEPIGTKTGLETVTQLGYPTNNNSINISSFHESILPLPLQDDIISIIYSARYQELSWDLSWEELSSRCEAYKEFGKQLRSEEKELKYLEVDYDNQTHR